MQNSVQAPVVGQYTPVGATAASVIQQQHTTPALQTPPYETLNHLAAPIAAHTQPWYGFQALGVPQQGQYNQFTTHPAPQTQMPYVIQAGGTYPVVQGPMPKDLEASWEADGCMKDPSGKWFKVLGNCSGNPLHFRYTPLRMLPDGNIVAIINRQIIWPEPLRMKYGAAPQATNPGQ